MMHIMSTKMDVNGNEYDVAVAFNHDEYGVEFKSMTIVDDGKHKLLPEFLLHMIEEDYRQEAESFVVESELQVQLDSYIDYLEDKVA